MSAHFKLNSGYRKVNPANLICFLRFVLVLTAVVVLLYVPGPRTSLVAAALIFVAVLLDAIDGAVARRYGFAGENGRLTDLYTDHAVANMLWVVFAVFGTVSVWVPLITTTRDLIVDYCRQVNAVATGNNGFAQVAQSRWRWLVSSCFMRAFYGAQKVVCWCLLATICCVTLPLAAQVLPYLVWSTCAICIVRAIPAVSVSWRYTVFHWASSV